MCGSSPKMPTPTEKDKPAVLLTARDGMNSSQAISSQGRKQLRIDLNKANNTPYGSSLVIPN